MGSRNEPSRLKKIFKPLTNRVRMAIECLLLLFSIALTSWLYFSEGSSVFFVSFLYLPVILACLWWGRKGFLLAGGLSLAILLLHFIDPGITSFWEDLLRVLALFLASLVIGEMSERQNRLVRRIDRQKKELEEFNHAVSHDLKGPLSTVSGFAEVALDASLRGDHDLSRECVDKIIRSAGRMRVSIDSLLALAESGASAAEPSSAHSSEVVEEVLMDYAAEIYAQGADIETDEGLPLVQADPAKLRQVFSNLVSNSLKYARKGVPLRLEIGFRPGDGDEVVLFLRDNGRGMDPGTLHDIFAPFRRFGPAGAPGSGLGLSIARSAVGSWGGRIWAESTPGEGSTFYFSVPLD